MSAQQFASVVKFSVLHHLKALNMTPEKVIQKIFSNSELAGVRLHSRVLLCCSILLSSGCIASGKEKQLMPTVVWA